MTQGKLYMGFYENIFALIEDVLTSVFSAIIGHCVA